MNSLFELQAVSDLYLDNVFYVTNYKNKIARISKCDYGWKVWYYSDKYGILRKALSDALDAIERHYKKRKDALFARTTRKSN